MFWRPVAVSSPREPQLLEGVLNLNQRIYLLIHVLHTVRPLFSGPPAM